MRQTIPLLLLLTLAGTPGHASDRETRKGWLPDEVPLPLPVKRPQDLAYKQVVEREYLIFNLLANAKLAWDTGNFAEAADQWETLLQLQGLDTAIDKVVRPFAIEARQKAGQPSAVSATPPAAPPVPELAPVGDPDVAEQSASRKRSRSRSGVDVLGSVTGGGPAGAGGAVIWLKRVDGKTPTPSISGDYVMRQTGKMFVPHVLVVPLGASVAFRNEDPIFHDVFSPTAPNDFDVGLYKSGEARRQTFSHPGAVQLLCNIHSSMNAWVVVVDSPWSAVADAAGTFRIRNVPTGDYTAEVWSAGSSQNATQRLTVSGSMAPVTLAVGGDRLPQAYPPDKYGKPRQPQLGY